MAVILSFSSCTSTKPIVDDAASQAKGNVSAGFSVGKVEDGVEVSGHASTKVFGVQPYGSFAVGVRYVPTPEPVVEDPVEPEL